MGAPQSTKFNGTSYISQRAAEATYSPEGHKQTRETIAYYMENARIMRETLTKLGYAVYGGENAPYLWVKTPNGMDSWKFFDTLLFGCGLVCTPGWASDRRVRDTSASQVSATARM